MLAVTGLSKRFGGFLAVNQVTFEVQEGEILGLIGPNGSGKSTTFNLIAGTLRPTEGSIRFKGAEIAGLAAHQICHRGIARTFQIPRPFRKLSLIENVTLAAYYGEVGHIARPEAHRRAEEALSLVGLPADADATTDGLGAAAPARRRKPRRFGFRRDGARREPAGEHSHPHAHHDRLGRAYHGGTDAHRRPSHRARSRGEDLRGPARTGGTRSARDRSLPRPAAELIRRCCPSSRFARVMARFVPS